jgi:hypothetical protein
MPWQALSGSCSASKDFDNSPCAAGSRRGSGGNHRWRSSSAVKLPVLATISSICPAGATSRITSILARHIPPSLHADGGQPVSSSKRRVPTPNWFWCKRGRAKRSESRLGNRLLYASAHSICRPAADAGSEIGLQKPKFTSDLDSRSLNQYSPDSIRGALWLADPNLDVTTQAR